ncbi:hypothetical protein V3C99_000190, partial [Haemonchus contortus]
GRHRRCSGRHRAVVPAVDDTGAEVPAVNGIGEVVLAV